MLRRVHNPPVTMNWIRVDCYEPNGQEPNGSQKAFYKQDSFCKPRRRCPLHKPIRNREWLEVRKLMREDPSQLSKMNEHGWSSLTLSIYHIAPVDIIAEMMSILSHEEQVTLLSTPVPNGSRLCLHFAARYANDLEVMKVLTGAYPPALLVKSTDGLTPFDRAVYYRKDAEILQYLEQATKKQQDLENLQKYNKDLRYSILLACERCRDSDERSRDSEQSFIFGEIDGTVVLTQELYSYCKEREMISLFWNVLSYVGVNSIP